MIVLKCVEYLSVFKDFGEINMKYVIIFFDYDIVVMMIVDIEDISGNVVVCIWSCKIFYSLLVVFIVSVVFLDLFCNWFIFERIC